MATSRGAGITSFGFNGSLTGTYSSCAAGFGGGCVCAGEALPAPLWQRWHERFGVEILDGIGSTEMLHIFLSNRPGEVR